MNDSSIPQTQQTDLPLYHQKQEKGGAWQARSFCFVHAGEWMDGMMGASVFSTTTRDSNDCGRGSTVVAGMHVIIALDTG